MRIHLIGLAAVSSAVVVGLGLLLARPPHDPSRLAEPPGSGLPFTKARFTAADASRVFAGEGIRLMFKSRTTGLTTLGDRRDVLEVDAFGDRTTVERTGFSDYTVAGVGAAAHYAHYPRDCRGGGLDAERWHGNIRVIVSCPRAGKAAPKWLRRVERALARL